MSIQTLGEAWQEGWRVKAVCDFGKRDAMKSIRACVYSYELDMKTLVYTRGLGFPLSDLPSRLKCPACGSREIRLIYTVPKQPNEAAIALRRRW